MSDTPHTDQFLQTMFLDLGSLGPHNCPEWLVQYARDQERELNQSKLDRLAAQVDADTWGNCAELLAHALRCANNSYAGSPEGQKQIDDALRVFEKLKGTK